MELFIDHYLTYKGDVNIYNLRADLQKYSQGRKSKKKFVIQSIKKMEDNLSYYSRERLTAFRPPKRVNIDREGYLEIIHDLKTFFSKQAIPRYLLPTNPTIDLKTEIYSITWTKKKTQKFEKNIS